MPPSLTTLRQGESVTINAQAKDVNGNPGVAVILDFASLATGTNTPDVSVFSVSTDVQYQATGFAAGTVTAVAPGTADLKVQGLGFTGTDDEDTRSPVTVLNASAIAFTPASLEYTASQGDDVLTATTLTTTGTTYPSGISIAGVDSRHGDGLSEPSYMLSDIEWTLEGNGADFAQFDTDNDGGGDGTTASGVTSSGLLIGIGDDIFGVGGLLTVKVTAKNSAGQTITGTLPVRVRLAASVTVTVVA